jgi:alpha-glucosidase
VTRHVTRYGGDDVEAGTRRARAATLLMLALPGSAYLYQGEEFGLPEVIDLPDELRQDPVFLRTKGARLGRDGSRVPLPWSGDEPPFGFGPGASTWLPQPPEWKALTAAAQEADPTSTWSMYQAALTERHRNPALGDGALTWLSAPAGVLALRRQPGFTCVVNFTAETIAVPDGIDGTLLVASDPAATATELPPDSAIWLADGA